MKDSRFPDLDHQLERLGQDLAQRQSVIPEVMDKIGGAIANTGIVPVPSEGRSPVEPGVKRRMLLRNAAFVTATCLVLAFVAFAMRPRSLYAKAIDALHNVQTIHVKGWSKEVPRDWPLEKPAEKNDVRHPVDMWFWRSVDGTPRTYEQYGPVTKILLGESEKEYQEDVDLLYLAEGRRNDDVEEIATISKFLGRLNGAKQESLGNKSVDGKTLRGVRVKRNDRIEDYWFDDATDLLVTYARTNGKGVQQFELSLTYDEIVPQKIVAYSPPKAKTIRYGGSHPDVSLAWKQHVQSLWQNSELPENGSVIVPREGNLTFEHQWTLATPDDKHTVFPIDLGRHGELDLDHFIRLRVLGQSKECLCGGCSGGCGAAAWKIAPELSEFRFPRADLVVTKGASWRDWTNELLDANGLKLTDVRQKRTYWIAKHDGSKLKPWHKVKPSVAYQVRNGRPLYGVLNYGRGKGINKGSGVTLERLFNEFNADQAIGYRTNGVIVVNETGLPRSPVRDKEKFPTWKEWETVLSEFYCATDAPFFARKDGRAMARKWYKENLGITFAEETREVTMHEITRK